MSKYDGMKNVFNCLGNQMENLFSKDILIIRTDISNDVLFKENDDVLLYVSRDGQKYRKSSLYKSSLKPFT